MLEIRKLLAEWRYERYIEADKQLEGLTKNIREEIDEYFDSSKKEDVHGMIDAFCDIMVFCYNTDPDLTLYNPFNKRKTIQLIREQVIQLEHIDNLKSVKRARVDSYIMSIIEMCENGIKSLGFDPKQCMIETIKEISSRKGSYNEDEKKWIKDKSPEAMTSWYKANYNNCIIDQSNIPYLMKGGTNHV